MGSEHEELCLEDRLVREGQVNCHLVAIEVGVETGTSERVELYSLTLDHLRLWSCIALPSIIFGWKARIP